MGSVYIANYSSHAGIRAACVHNESTNEYCEHCLPMQKRKRTRKHVQNTSI